MTLEEYRRDQSLSYEQLADRIGVSSASTARRYAVGARRPEADEVERICKATGGVVTPEEFHRARLQFLNRSSPSFGLASGDAADPAATVSSPGAARGTGEVVP